MAIHAAAAAATDEPTKNPDETMAHQERKTQSVGRGARMLALSWGVGANEACKLV
jgi:hypothetical protein